MDRHTRFRSRHAKKPILVCRSRNLVCRGWTRGSTQTKRSVSPTRRVRLRRAIFFVSTFFGETIFVWTRAVSTLRNSLNGASVLYSEYALLASTPTAVLPTAYLQLPTPESPGARQNFESHAANSYDSYLEYDATRCQVQVYSCTPGTCNRRV